MFRGCSFGCADSIAANSELLEEVKKILSSNGGTFNSRGTKSLTHFLIEGDNLDMDKRLEYEEKGVFLLPLQFIFDCKKKKKRLNEADYQISNPFPAKIEICGDVRNSPSRHLHVPPEHSAASLAEKFADASNILVPVDSFVPNSENYVVLSDLLGPYEAFLTQTDIKNNSNKFYLLQLLKQQFSAHFFVWRRWGRVGANGQTQLDEFDGLEAAENFFKSKFLEKTGNQWDSRKSFERFPSKYVFAERLLSSPRKSSESYTIKSELHPGIQRLIKTICDKEVTSQKLRDVGYDIQNAPLKNLSSETIRSAHKILIEIEGLLNDGNLAQTIEKSNEFYSLIPHDFGLSIPHPINRMDLLEEKFEMLQQIQNIQSEFLSSELNMTSNPISLDEVYSKLNVPISVISKSDPNYLLLEQYFKNSDFHMERYEVVEIYSIGSDNSQSIPNDYNHLLLWYGLPIVDVSGALQRGLHIPRKQPLFSHLLGNALYFTDFAWRSINRSSFTGRNGSGYLLLCQVALGNSLKLLVSNDEAEKLVIHGEYDSIIGLGSISPSNIGSVKIGKVIVPNGPPIYTDCFYSTFKYNEYAIFDQFRAQIRYLFEIKIV